MLWGRSHEPPRYELVSFLFLRLFGLVTLSAFVSFAVQAQGLIGSRGILPLSELVEALARFRAERFLLAPMVFWLNDSDLAIQAVCWGGAGFSLMLVLNLLPRLSLVLIYALYLSLHLRRADFYELPVGHVPSGDRGRCVHHELEADHRRLARALAPVPLHVHVGGRQADQRRSQLAESHGAQLPFSDAAAADAACLVRRKAASRPVGGRDRFHVCRRARSAVPHLLPAALKVCLGVRDPAVRRLHSPHRQLQLVQPADDALVPAAVRRRGAAANFAVSPNRARADGRKISDAATDGRQSRSTPSRSSWCS